MKNQILIGPFTQVIPMTNLPLKGALKDDNLTIISNGGILISENTIFAVGDYNKLKSDYPNSTLQYISEPSVALPGLIDSHTHICYAGSRARDYAMRNAGQSYLEIAKAGGGIWDTVTQTRKATQKELEALTIQRANKHLENGITTIEVKSGYGLSVDEELKMLRAIKNADTETKADLISTCLAAHIFPKDYNGTIEDYLKEAAETLFPIIKEEQLASRVDAFIEDSAFTKDNIKPYFKKAQELGFSITVHADQFTTSGSEAAIEFNAISADHLEASTEKEIEILAKSNTIATALPGASIGLGCAYTPARQLLDKGACVAIASDHNPGSAPMGDLLTQAAILGTFEKLSNTEVLAGITYRAAAALELNDRGQLKAGHLADIIAFKTADYREILYQQGQLKPSWVWKHGDLVVDC